MELEGSFGPLRSFLDFFEKFCRHKIDVGSRIKKGFDSDVSFDDDGKVKLSCYTFFNEIAKGLRDWSLGGNI